MLTPMSLQKDRHKNMYSGLSNQMENIINLSQSKTKLLKDLLSKLKAKLIWTRELGWFPLWHYFPVA